MKDAPRILMVVTSRGDINEKPTTGIWYNEFAEPFRVFLKAGAIVTVASPRGGSAPIDPRSYPTREAIADERDALATLNATTRLFSVADDIFDGVFFPGGHGPMFDLANDLTTKAMIAAYWAAGKPVSAVCYGLAALLGVPLADGTTLLDGRTVTGFTRAEDALDDLFAHMPFSLQTRMEEEGASFVERPPGSVHVETDGLLVTGQNPESALATAEAFITTLRAAMPRAVRPHPAAVPAI